MLYKEFKISDWQLSQSGMKSFIFTTEENFRSNLEGRRGRKLLRQRSMKKTTLNIYNTYESNSKQSATQEMGRPHQSECFMESKREERFGSFNSEILLKIPVVPGRILFLMMQVHLCVCVDLRAIVESIQKVSFYVQAHEFQSMFVKGVCVYIYTPTYIVIIPCL